MAKTEENIRGKVGNTVFYRVGDETRVRGTSGNYLDANTREQQDCRSRLRTAVRFYQRVPRGGVRETWKIAAEDAGKNGYNLFMKQNMMVFKPNGKIGDFSRLQLTAGSLQKVDNLVATAGEDNTVTLAWEKEADLPTARVDDRLMVVVLYGNRSFTPVPVEGIAASRGEGKAVFRLRREKGIAAHLYCFFGAKEGRAYSESQYIRV